ncbi:hypothetical protein [Caloranaerobacter sp. DY30410]|uniref:hypothetical protein n=1 Tax=Caloranaerobacter sp. DY30410 TaxID=3238305 RepID=UPI003D017BF1
MKRRITSFLLMSFILTVMCIPAFANSESWSFVMDYRVVNGKDNGQIHAMDSGNMVINGDIWTYSKDPGSLDSPNKVYVYVYQDVFGPDRKVGYTTVTPYSELNSPKSFSKGFGFQNSGDYYLVIAKSNDDGYNLKGEGTLTTN